MRKIKKVLQLKCASKRQIARATVAECDLRKIANAGLSWSLATGC